MKSQPVVDLRKNAQVLLCLDLALRDARTPYNHTSEYYQPMNQRKVVALAKSYGRKHGLSADDIHAVLAMSVAEALGVTQAERETRKT